jgi:hypothetical protein
MLRYSWILLGVVMVLVGCAPIVTPTPTPTLRPTLEPRVPPTAQPPPMVLSELVPDMAVEVTLPGLTYVELPYTAEVNQMVTIVAAARSDDTQGYALDVVLEMLDDDRRHVAYNDDAPLFSLDGFATAPNDAAIVGLPLSAGNYTVRVNAFNGFQSGDVEILLTVASP